MAASSGDLFTDVTSAAGISQPPNVIYSISWVDFNGDDYNDLWVGRHFDANRAGNEPNLYLNQGDGTFQDVAAAAFPATIFGGDNHGSIWVDLDGDGDQDFFGQAGAAGGTSDTGSPNFLFKQQNGTMTQVLGASGMELRPARGRDPLVFDWNADGRLDVLLANDRRPDGQYPSALYQQQADGTFIDVTSSAGLNLVNKPGQFFRVGDITGDGIRDLIFSRTDVLEFYRGQANGQFTLVSGYLPADSHVHDVAIADFSGDGFNDVYVARSRLNISDVQLFSPNIVSATLFQRTTENGFRFRTTGELRLDFRDEHLADGRASPARIFLGASGQHPAGIPVTLSSDNPDLFGIAAHPTGNGQGLYVGYDPATQLWEVRYTSAAFSRLDMVFESTAEITDLTTFGAAAGEQVAQTGRLLIYDPLQGKLVDTTATAGLSSPRATGSVVAGDLDNDLDVDLYFSEETAVVGLPDEIALNNGDGTFTIHQVQATSRSPGPHVAHFGDGTKAIVADYDLDGSLDVFLNATRFPTDTKTYEGAPNQLLHNQGNGNHWLLIDLDGVASNPEGIGARIEASVGGKILVREHYAGKHHQAQDSALVHLGLGANAVIDSLTIRWPSGTVQQLSNVTADQVLQITEPGEPPPPPPRLKRMCFWSPEEIRGWCRVLMPRPWPWMIPTS